MSPQAALNISIFNNSGARFALQQHGDYTKHLEHILLYVFICLHIEDNDDDLCYDG